MEEEKRTAKEYLYVETGLKKIGYTRNEITTLAQNRTQWTAFVDSPCSQGANRPK